MTVRYTDEDIKWIKQYRTDNDCGLQVAKRVLLRSRIQKRLDTQNITSHDILKGVLEDMMELMR
jgi:hypothetical protein